MTNEFSGKTVLISGAGGGFGIGATREFARQGANLVLTDHTQDLLDAALEIADQHGVKAAGIAGDIADELLSKQLVEIAQKNFGGLDIALNNAGMAHPQMRLEKIANDLAKRVMDVDVMGIFYAMKHQLPVMRAQFEETGEQRVIVNTSSVAGVIGAPMLSIYSAAKHAVVGMTKAAALENARKGIRVNAICPAFTRTNMVQEALDTSPHGIEEAERRLTNFNPMRRLGEADEVVQAMLWICSPRNSFYTGQALNIDGGLSAA